ncbi:hypothetical protein A3848_06165 [Paenibacillus sp. P32E]|nr:hypothetical protein A3848_06165 [Paenibacillus sp. P32E]
MKINIRYPLNIRLIIGMSILTLLCILNIIATSDRSNKLLYLAFSIVYLLIITAAVTRRLLKPKLLQLDNKVLIIKNYQLEASEISQINIERNGIIGIKPKRNRIVPIGLCFEFSNTNKEINTLIEWAKNNNIEVNHKTFFKWI